MNRCSWNDICGYELLRASLKRVRLFFDRAKYLRSRGISIPNGLLLFGPPGTGKTHSARILAKELGHQVRLLRPSDFISKWLGEGVERIRAHADWAIRTVPSMLIIDELDAIAPKRTGSSTVDHDSLTMVNELLTQLDRLAEAPHVVVVATTNAMARLDPAVIRTGRFSLKIPVGPPNKQDRREILQHYLATSSSARGLAEVKRKWVKRTKLMSPSDIATLIAEAKLSHALDESEPDGLAGYVSMALKAAPDPDFVSLLLFLDDLKLYAGAEWQKHYSWVGKALERLGHARSDVEQHETVSDPTRVGD